MEIEIGLNSRKEWLVGFTNQFNSFLCFQRNGEVEMRKNTSKVLPFWDPNLFGIAMGLLKNWKLLGVSLQQKKKCAKTRCFRRSVKFQRNFIFP